VMTGAHLARLATAGNARARHIGAITRFYADFYRQRAGLDGIFVHDSSTISIMLAPQHYTTVSYPIRVDTGHSFGRGRTIPAVRTADHETPWSGRRAVTIATAVDSDAVVELELGRLLA